jgi:putative ABC transport system permease protein
MHRGDFEINKRMAGVLKAASQQPGCYPAGWYIMNYWLLDFAYRISISWWVFPVAGVFILLIGILTISFQAIRAALANPVNSLRTE